MHHFAPILRRFCADYAQVDIPVTSHNTKCYARIEGFGPLIRRKRVEISKPLLSLEGQVDSSIENACAPKQPCVHLSECAPQLVIANQQKADADLAWPRPAEASLRQRVG